MSCKIYRAGRIYALLVEAVKQCSVIISHRNVIFLIISFVSLNVFGVPLNLPVSSFFLIPRSVSRPVASLRILVSQRACIYFPLNHRRDKINIALKPLNGRILCFNEISRSFKYLLSLIKRAYDISGIFCIIFLSSFRHRSR